MQKGREIFQMTEGMKERKKGMKEILHRREKSSVQSPCVSLSPRNIAKAPFLAHRGQALLSQSNPAQSSEQNVPFLSRKWWEDILYIFFFARERKFSFPCINFFLLFKLNFTFLLCQLEVTLSCNIIMLFKKRKKQVRKANYPGVDSSFFRSRVSPTQILSVM